MYFFPSFISMFSCIPQYWSQELLVIFTGALKQLDGRISTLPMSHVTLFTTCPGCSITHTGRTRGILTATQGLGKLVFPSVSCTAMSAEISKYTQLTHTQYHWVDSVLTIIFHLLYYVDTIHSYILSAIIFQIFIHISRLLLSLSCMTSENLTQKKPLLQ